MAVVGIALMGMSLLYYIFKDPGIILGFSFGASSLALLAKAGGGIYTKTADIGADLAGKFENNLAEDDPRNPGVIADNVGDNVGDVAGMGADIFDSYVASTVAVMILGYKLYKSQVAFTLYPLLLCAVGILASLFGLVWVRFKKSEDPGDNLNSGTVATIILFAILSYLVAKWLGFTNPWGIYLPTMAGLAGGIIIGFSSDKYSDWEQEPVQKTAAAAKIGAAILILNGFSYGLYSLIFPVVGIALASMIAYGTATYFGLAGTYGVAVSAVGMLAVTGMIVSADAYGPIVDNANGCATAGNLDKKTLAVCYKLDKAGNTAKAITKGFAVGAAALTALALFAAYSQTVGLKVLDLNNPGVVLGLFLGGLMPPVFSAMLMLSVSKNAFLMVEEIRRQFEEIPGLLQGKAKPDSERCVDIASQAALKELARPALLCFLTSLSVGFIFGPKALGGFLAGAIVVGTIFALFMANAGGLWDNAKKVIEDGKFGGEGSEAHKAAIIGDTVGDPFKDTAGPSINTLITVMSLVATIFGGLVAKYSLFKF